MNIPSRRSTGPLLCLLALALAAGPASAQSPSADAYAEAGGVLLPAASATPEAGGVPQPAAAATPAAAAPSPVPSAGSGSEVSKATALALALAPASSHGTTVARPAPVASVVSPAVGAQPVTARAGTLAFTGLDLTIATLVALVLLSTGFVLRHATRTPS